MTGAGRAAQRRGVGILAAMRSDGPITPRSPAALLPVLLAVCVMAVACGGIEAAAPPATTSVAPTTTASAPPSSVAPSPSTSPAPTTTAPTTTTGSPPPSAAYPAPTAGVVDRWVPEVVATSPHDPAAFTQGLVVRGDTVYESTGLYGQSTVRIVDRDAGEVRLLASLDATLFGEGLELVDDRLIQITWREGTSIVWDAATLEERGRFAYEGEGWGLCHDGVRLVMSDGTATLTFRDPESFAATGAVTVTLGGDPVTMLNELECVAGLVFANVWQTTDIVVIEPDSGVVTAVIDAAALDTIDDASGAAVLNGIAYDAAGDVFLVTGKLWPTMYEVRFVEE